MNELNELIAIATIFIGILLLLVAFILSAGVFLFDFELPTGNSFGSYAVPLAIGAIGYILFGVGFGEFLKQRRNPVYPFFFILYIVSILLTIYLIK